MMPAVAVSAAVKEHVSYLIHAEARWRGDLVRAKMRNREEEWFRAEAQRALRCFAWLCQQPFNQQ
jgi:hypothetical protein